MKRTVISLLLMVLTALLLPGQEATAGQIPPLPLEERQRLPELKELAGFSYAYLECRGAYAQLPAKINEFMGLFFKQGLMPQGNFFAMYLNSPRQVKPEELQWRLGFPVAAGAEPAAPLQKGEFKATQAAVYLFVGPYEQVEYAYGKIAGFLAANGLQAAGPSIETYLDMNPMAVKPEERRTEILMPVIKK